MGINMKAPADIYKALLEAGNQWADANYTWQVLDDATKPILAKNTLDAKHAEDCSVAEAEKIGLSANMYRDHLQAVAIAKREALKAKIKYDSTRSYADHCRTQEASERAAMRNAT